MTGRSIRPALPPTGRLLARVLEAPDLIRSVRELEPEALLRLIDHIGLEDSGEIVALATAEQLVDCFDADLWGNDKPGAEERFDADRFAIWLEVMLEAGEKAAADRISELPESLVMLALSRQILVLDMDQLAVEMASERQETVDLTDKALDSCLHLELSEYRAVARRSYGWDAVAALLLALDENHHELLMRILERCWHASAEYIAENGGLYRVLTSEEMLESDAGAEREDRRAAKGYVSPPDASAFLKMVRSTDPTEIDPSTPRDPITLAYFRNLDRERNAPARRSATGTAVEPPEALVRLLTEAGATVPAQALLPPSRRRKKKPAGKTDLFRLAMATLFERDPGRHAERMEELAYLANLLSAGGDAEGRRLRPIEAAEKAVEFCGQGLSALLDRDTAEGDERSPEKRACDLLARLGADIFFRAGWAAPRKR